MKILIVSDTHRRDENLRYVIEKVSPIDMLIHLGDAEGSEDRIADWVNEGCQLEMVLGNNDFFSALGTGKRDSNWRLPGIDHSWALLRRFYGG